MSEDIVTTERTLQIIVENRHVELTSEGMQGPPGTAGQSGDGIAAGGAIGQFLRKKSNSDFDTEWVDLAIPPQDATISYSDGRIDSVTKGDTVYAFTYNPNGTLNTVNNGVNTWTFGYTSIALTSITVS